MTVDPLTFLHATLAAAQADAEAARDVDYARCGVWEARGPYPAASGEADGVSRPRGNLRAQIGTDDIFLDAELPWDLVPHMARHDPAAVLHRIEADRKLIELHTTPHTVVDGFCVEEDGTCTRRGEDDCAMCGQQPCDTLTALAEGWGWTGEVSP